MFAILFHPGKIGSHEQLTTSPIPCSLASLSISDCDSIDFEILSDSDEASDDKELVQRSSQTGSSSFVEPVADRRISLENQTPLEHVSSGLNVMESARNALQRSSFVHKRTYRSTNSFSVSSSSSDAEDDVLGLQEYEENYMCLSLTSSDDGVDVMDDDLNLSNQPESFTRLLSLTDHSSQRDSIGRHSDSESDIDKHTSVVCAPDMLASPTVSHNKNGAAKSSASPKKTTGDVGHEVKKPSSLQVSLLYDWHVSYNLDMPFVFIHMSV